MMSGLTGQNDNVRMFFASENTSIDTDANRVYNDPNMPEKIKFLIDKNGRVMMRGALVTGQTELRDVRVTGRSELHDSYFYGLIRDVSMNIDDSNFSKLFTYDSATGSYKLNTGTILMQRSRINIYYAKGNMTIILPYKVDSNRYGGNDPLMFVGCMVRIINYTNYEVVIKGTVPIGYSAVSEITLIANQELFAQCELTMVNSSSRRIWWRRLYKGGYIDDGIQIPPTSGDAFPAV